MRQLKDLSNLEILSLSEEDKQNYVDIELMIAGIEVPPMPQAVPAPDFSGLPRRSFMKIDAFLLDVENTEALAYLQQLEVYSENYDYAIGYEPKYWERSELSISQKSLVDEGSYKGAAIQQRAVVASRKEYERAYSSWKEIDSKAQKVRNATLDRINEAQAKYRRAEQIRLQFEKYLRLAGDDETVAMRFLENATPRWELEEAREFINLPCYTTSPEQQADNE